MNKLNELLQELGISKVRLAKYLGVSRQMVYNYLELDDINKWPKEKKILLFKLLDIQDSKDIENVDITTDYLMNVENRLNQSIKSNASEDAYLDIKSLNKDAQNLLSDMFNLMKEKLSDDRKKEENYYAFLYLYHMLHSMNSVPEIKYIFGYMSKITGFTNPDDFKFNEDRQFIFESIMFSGMILYTNGNASKLKLAESHNRFEKYIEQKKEEKLSRTQELNTAKVQALKELGYTEINESNAQEVLEKIAEIQSRKV